jgi:hypothetical protein
MSFLLFVLQFSILNTYLFYLIPFKGTIYSGFAGL